MRAENLQYFQSEIVGATAGPASTVVLNSFKRIQIQADLVTRRILKMEHADSNNAGPRPKFVAPARTIASIAARMAS